MRYRGRTRLGRPAGAISLKNIRGQAPTFEPGECSTGVVDPDSWTGGPREDEAVVICWSCPVRIACLTWALGHRETDGIWGGLTPSERRDQNVVRAALSRV
jgi:Transcription factor WhiB